MWEEFSHSPEETRRIASDLAALLESGDTVLLTGDLGSGKSEFARGIARALGYQCPIPSPTFTLMNVYRGGRCALCHYDLYRIRSADEFFESGLDEFIGADCIAVIEWPEIIAPYPENAVCAAIQTTGEGERRISVCRKGDFRKLNLRGKNI